MSQEGEGPNSDDKEWLKKIKDKSSFILYFRILEKCAEFW